MGQGQRDWQEHPAWRAQGDGSGDTASPWFRGHRGEGGSNVGRGPRGYVRGDARVQEDVCEELSQDPHVDASGITVEVRDGEVTLSGRVPDRAQKRHAELCVERVRGVKDVLNRVRVARDQGSAGEASGLTFLGAGGGVS